MNPRLPEPVSAPSADDPGPDYEIAIAARPGHLYVAVSGTNSIDTVRRYSADVREACIRLGQTRVLIVVNLRGPKLSMLDVYKAVAAGSDEAVGLGMRVAYVDIRPDPSVENMQIAEHVATTRGTRVRAFVDIVEAEAWLLDKKSS